MKHGQYSVPHFLNYVSSFVSLRSACDEDKRGDQWVKDSFKYHLTLKNGGKDC